MHEIVMDWVREELSSGRLTVGDHLPSERALAEKLRVSRGSLREALRVLEALGTIRSSTGSGPSSGTILTAAPEQALTLSLRLQLATSHIDYQHLCEVRVLIERWAAEHADGERGEWNEVERLLDLMDQSTLTPVEFLELDAQFHETLSRSAGNPLVSTLMGALRQSISEHTIARVQSDVEWQEIVVTLREEHRGVYEALRAGENTRAADLLVKHIHGFYVRSGVSDYQK